MIPLSSQQTNMSRFAPWQPHSYYHGKGVQNFSRPPSNIALDGETMPARPDYMTWDRPASGFRPASLVPYHGGTNIPDNDILYPTRPIAYSQGWHHSWQPFNEGIYGLSSTSNLVPSAPSLELQPNISQTSGSTCFKNCGCPKFNLDNKKCLGYGFRKEPGLWCECGHQQQDHSGTGIEAHLPLDTRMWPKPEVDDYLPPYATDARLYSREADACADTFHRADTEATTGPVVTLTTAADNAEIDRAAGQMLNEEAARAHPPGVLPLQDTQSQKREASTNLVRTDTTGQVRKRASKACGRCRACKVRCDVTIHGIPCTNCRLDEEACIIPVRCEGRKRNKRDSVDEHASQDSGSDSSGDAGSEFQQQKRRKHNRTENSKEETLPTKPMLNTRKSPTTVRPSKTSQCDFHTKPSPVKGSKSSSGTGPKAFREKLAEGQRRENHNDCERKRRKLINAGWEELRQLVPELKADDHRIQVLNKGAAFLEDLVKGNRALREWLGSGRVKEIQQLRTQWEERRASLLSRLQTIQAPQDISSYQQAGEDMDALQRIVNQLNELG